MLKVNLPRNADALTCIVESYPNGYPRVSALLDSDDCFPLYRRFGYLQSRLLLQKQDELRELEDSLREMDERDDKTEEGQDCLQSRDLDDRRDLPEGRVTRRALLQRIEKKMLEYGKTRMSLLPPCFLKHRAYTYSINTT